MGNIYKHCCSRKNSTIILNEEKKNSLAGYNRVNFRTSESIFAKKIEEEKVNLKDFELITV